MDTVKIPKVLIVTPARDEATNIGKLAESLRNQSVRLSAVWIVVDDGSIDNTRKVVEQLSMPFEVIVIARELSGTLITGSAFTAWLNGVNFGLVRFPDAEYIMKLDADVLLTETYFELIFKELVKNKVGIIGGVLFGSQTEQKIYVPGPVKMYSKDALDLVRQLPVATGFDVMDEVLCHSKGVKVQIVKGAKFRMGREIGHSQGLLHGRYRNGLVCRWVGYAPEYFLLHLIRYLFRAPYFLGSVWMFFGYCRAGQGPYAQDLKKNHRLMQRSRLAALVRNPYKSTKDLYF